jgi:ketohexokinase
MKHIVAVGIATLDIINIIDNYPQEDSEVRVAAQRLSRGGNATNTLVVLSQLGHNCTWLGVWVNEPDGQLILADLQRYNINTKYCPSEKHGKIPTSYVLLNRQTGSRTIIHYRNLPELSFAQFKTMDFSQVDWLHFEGRNVFETSKMLQWTRENYPNLPISLEAEKPRLGIESLWQYADLLLCSQALAQHYGYQDARKFLTDLRQQVSQANLVCTWGASGAYALAKGNKIEAKQLHSPAYPPVQLVDTLGAGDTFNASLIDSLIRGQDLAVALHEACWLAGQKCGQVGLENLSKFKQNI